MATAAVPLKVFRAMHHYFASQPRCSNKQCGKCLACLNCHCEECDGDEARQSEEDAKLQDLENIMESLGKEAVKLRLSSSPSLLSSVAASITFDGRNLVQLAKQESAVSTLDELRSFKGFVKRARWCEAIFEGLVCMRFKGDGTREGKAAALAARKEVDETGEHYHNWKDFCRNARYKGDRIFTHLSDTTNNLYIRLAELALDYPEVASLEPPHRFWTQFATHAERLIGILRQSIEKQGSSAPSAAGLAPSSSSGKDEKQPAAMDTDSDPETNAESENKEGASTEPENKEDTESEAEESGAEPAPQAETQPSRELRKRKQPSPLSPAPAAASPHSPSPPATPVRKRQKTKPSPPAASQQPLFSPVLSFCLFKRSEQTDFNWGFSTYVDCLISLVRHLRVSALSNWKTVVYVDSTVDKKTRTSLLQAGVDEIREPEHVPEQLVGSGGDGDAFRGFSGKLMRLWAFADFCDAATHVVTLDCDLPFSSQQESLLLDWAAGKHDVLRLIHNSYAEEKADVPLCAGMLGLAGEALRDVGKRFLEALQEHCSENKRRGDGDKQWPYGSDQAFLAQHVFPLLKDKFRFLTLAVIPVAEMPKPVLPATWQVKHETIFENRTMSHHEVF